MAVRPRAAGRLGRKEQADPPAPEQRPPCRPGLDLSQAYSIDGWFGDSFTDLIPDRLETSIVVGDPAESLGAAHIAARLGLETTGITLPPARDHRKVTNPATESNAILVGRANDLVQQLAKIGKARLDDLKPGEGAVQVVPRAFGPSSATVVAGVDAAGTDAAAGYLARRLPYCGTSARRFGLDDEEQAADFFGARCRAGSLALRKWRHTSRAAGQEARVARCQVYAGRPTVRHVPWRPAKESLKETAITTTSQGSRIGQGVRGHDRHPWELSFAKFRSESAEGEAGSSVTLEARLSESPQVRKDTEEIQRATVKAGAKVQVLSATSRASCG